MNSEDSSEGTPQQEQPGTQPVDDAMSRLRALREQVAPDQRDAKRSKRIAGRARRERRMELMSSTELRTESQRRDLLLRERVATFALLAITAELLIANAVFVLYAWLGKNWDVPTTAIDVWLGATVVQVIGILYVIAGYLFPRDGTLLNRRREEYEGVD